MGRGQPGSVSKFPPFLWVKLWVGWVGRGYRRVMCFRGSSVFVGSFSGAFSRARGKISQLTHVYKHLPRVACCLIQVLSIKFISIFAASSSRGSVGKQVFYLMTISCRFSSRCCSGTSAKKIEISRCFNVYA